jgi:hypothetical protein
MGPTRSSIPKRLRYAALCLYGLGVHGPAAAQGPSPSHTADLVLQTQYDSVVSLQAMRGNVVVLVYGDREGSRYMSSYVKAVRERWPAGGADAVRLIEAADLRGVPGVMKGYAKSRFRQPTSSGARRVPVVLDWRGDIARRFGATEKLANAYVLDEDGTFRWTDAGTGTPEQVAALLAAVEAARKLVRDP